LAIVPTPENIKHMPIFLWGNTGALIFHCQHQLSVHIPQNFHPRIWWAVFEGIIQQVFQQLGKQQGITK
jgi:hypothetical protein